MPTTVTASCTPAGLNSKSSAQFLADRQIVISVYSIGGEAVLLGPDRVGGRLERADQEVALLVGQHRALFARPLVLDLDVRAGDERVRLVANRSREAALVDLRKCRRGASRRRRNAVHHLRKVIVPPTVRLKPDLVESGKRKRGV